MQSANAKVTHYGGILDITERKQTEADLRRPANYDVLAGLPNRSLFSSRLLQSIPGRAANGRNWRYCSWISIDLSMLMTLWS